jgi:hypothetical protein
MKQLSYLFKKRDNFSKHAMCLLSASLWGFLNVSFLIRWLDEILKDPHHVKTSRMTLLCGNMSKSFKNTSKLSSLSLQGEILSYFIFAVLGT